MKETMKNNVKNRLETYGDIVDKIYGYGGFKENSFVFCFLVSLIFFVFCLIFLFYQKNSKFDEKK